MFVAGEMFTVASGKVCIGFNTFCSDLEISWFSPPLKSRVGLGPRILSLRVYDRESFTSFHVQAVVPVILVKPIDTLPLASVNIVVIIIITALLALLQTHHPAYRFISVRLIN